MLRVTIIQDGATVLDEEMDGLMLFYKKSDQPYQFLARGSLPKINTSILQLFLLKFLGTH